jgi:3-phosphoshikimate 1-carboxyvinyltransferase
LEEENALPVRIKGCGCNEKQTVSLDISKSTQFLSALMMIGCMCKNGLEVEITSDKKTGSYIDITKNMVEEFGGSISFDGKTYTIEPKTYNIEEYQVEPDVSAACYFYGIAAIYGCKALVYNVHFNSTQGDIRFIKVLEEMGCNVSDTIEGIEVIGPKKLKGIENVDMNNFSDQALTLANVAIFADSPTTISNISHIRGQECDRLNAIAQNLTKMGIKVEEREDSITIYPGEFESVEIETFEDHRVAMSFTMSGMGEKSLRILNPMCCRKTFENYFEIIDGLC